MATAGDGGVRSARRQQDETVTFRCTRQQKAGYRRAFNRQGFRSLSAWIKDCLHSEGQMSLHLRRVLCGRLGQIGARMIALAGSDLPEDAKTEVHALAAEITQLQDNLISGRIDAREAD